MQAHRNSMAMFLFVLLLIKAFSVQAMADAVAQPPEGNQGNAHKSQDKNSAHPSEVAQQLEKYFRINEKNILCCINMPSQETSSSAGKFRKLIEDLHTYVFITHQGSLQVGESFDVTPYYEPGLSVAKIVLQLREANFALSGMYLEENCYKLLAQEKTNTCSQNSLCATCPYRIVLSYHDNCGSQPCSVMGHPIYQIVLHGRGETLIKTEGVLRASK